MLHIELIYLPVIWSWWIHFLLSVVNELLQSLYTLILSCVSCCSFEIFKYFIDLYLFISLYDFLAYSSIVSIVSCKTFSWLLLFIIFIGSLYFSCIQLYFKPHEFTICFCNVLVLLIHYLLVLILDFVKCFQNLKIHWKNKQMYYKKI